MLVGAGLGAPPLDIDMRQAAGSGICHQFHWCCRGRGVFLLVQLSYFLCIIRIICKNTVDNIMS